MPARGAFVARCDLPEKIIPLGHQSCRANTTVLCSWDMLIATVDRVSPVSYGADPPVRACPTAPYSSTALSGLKLSVGSRMHQAIGRVLQVHSGRPACVHGRDIDLRDCTRTGKMILRACIVTATLGILGVRDSARVTSSKQDLPLPPTVKLRLKPGPDSPNDTA